MSHLRRCTECGALTLMQNCSKCHGSTSACMNSLPIDRDAYAASQYAVSSCARTLTEGVTDQHSFTSRTSSAESPASIDSGCRMKSELKHSAEFNEVLKKSPNDLVQENMALHDELKKTNALMMQLSMGILSLHDSTNASRRGGLELIEKLLSDNRLLRQQLGHLCSPLMESDPGKVAQAPIALEVSGRLHQNQLEAPDRDGCVLSFRHSSTYDNSKQILAEAQEEIVRLQGLVKEKNAKIHWFAERVKKTEEILDALVAHLSAVETTTQAGGEADKIFDRYAVTDLMGYGDTDYSLSPSLAKSYEKLMKR
ncbi:unnamed protein product [Phytomonas sp. EM1]|nr:unnamed protein product [Phytomonas sp. EM1]|eukprot:CCW60279.1 unnamed protein product [Phytomonas sp. isolate EM1]